jgi:hypothetical protein
MNRHAASAQIESEDVDAVNVFITGDNDNSARNANIDDLTVFASIAKANGNGRYEHTGCVARRKGHTVCGLPRLAELSC